MLTSQRVYVGLLVKLDLDTLAETFKGLQYHDSIETNHRVKRMRELVGEIIELKVDSYYGAWAYVWFPAISHTDS